jgi:hypothetical protein
MPGVRPLKEERHMSSSNEPEQTYDCSAGKHKFKCEHYEEEASPDYDGPVAV